MSRPLLICDCDEVLLHFVPSFREWLAEVHAMDIALAEAEMSVALTRRSDGAGVPRDQFMPLLDSFFTTEMARQTPIAGAREALTTIARDADVVILTNLTDARRDARAEQLARLGFDYPVVTNQGPKGGAVVRLLEKYHPASAVFVDDLARHIASVADLAPDVWRLHLIGTPEMASLFPPAPRADARIDGWAMALPWIQGHLAMPRPQGAERRTNPGANRIEAI